jgi:hypothetical protein|eukprot:CAMPEP_0174280402 /NCGR_PEP_ID=MMETSP0809-20121228/687_1 /TAXON_ID=73025 ORGANISM="Eutreptiella gymnastica-like, Strain CCMP1594" /NCGR_SAMPLE_ID=MMETSP0809 /ASSEMBLY_ACC=CAM_ASM_000658 /LENGTH=329 /DNA_ID=CAMNT_0015373263 /DNA_START=32 /DNA_END=1021 /DNA_ORIENTATION=+
MYPTQPVYQSAYIDPKYNGVPPNTPLPMTQPATVTYPPTGVAYTPYTPYPGQPTVAYGMADPFDDSLAREKKMRKNIKLIKLFALIGIIGGILFVAANLTVVIKSISDAVDKASNGQGFDYEGAIGIVLLCTLLVPIVWFICNNGHFCLGDKIFACWPCGGRPMRLDPSASLLSSCMSMCCVCNKTTPLVVKHACCLPYRCFGYAPVPLLAGQFLGPIAGETEPNYIDAVKEASWTSNAGVYLIPVYIINVALFLAAMSSDWDNAAYIVPLVIVFIPLVLALFGCYKICKYDSKPENIAEEQLRIEHYGYGQTYNWKQRLQQKKMPSVV